MALLYKFLPTGPDVAGDTTIIRHKQKICLIFWKENRALIEIWFLYNISDSIRWMIEFVFFILIQQNHYVTETLQKNIIIRSILNKCYPHGLSWFTILAEVCMLSNNKQLFKIKST